MAARKLAIFASLGEDIRLELEPVLSELGLATVSARDDVEVLRVVDGKGASLVLAEASKGSEPCVSLRQNESTVAQVNQVLGQIKNDRRPAIFALRERAVPLVESMEGSEEMVAFALAVRPGDRVAMPSYVCAALLHAADLAGAEPLLVDIDPTTFNLDPDDLRKRLRSRTKAVIVPHMFGLPAPFRDIEAWGVPVIEDCALFIEEVRDLRSYDGRSRHRRRFNYKMTEFQAALGRVQLRKLSHFVARRRRLASLYARTLCDGPWDLPSVDRSHSF